MDLSTLCHTTESLAKLPTPYREIVLDLAQEVSGSGTETPFETKQAIWSTFAKMKIEVPSDIFRDLEYDDSVEVWTSDLRFLFAMGPVLTMTNYTLEELATISWASLFERPDVIEKQVIAKFLDAITTQKTQYNVADWHLVRERMSASRAVISVRIKQFVPFNSKSQGLSGVFALVKAKKLA